MTEQRRADDAPTTSAKATGFRELDALRASDAPLAEFVKAGGLRRIPTSQMFEHRPLIEGSIRGTHLRAACTCGWVGERREKHGTEKDETGRTVTTAVASTERANAEIAAHLAGGAE